MAGPLPVHPDAPDRAGRFDVAGGALTGFPAINIGFNKDVAWSHTVSTGYRFTPYQYTTAGTPTSYQIAGGGTAELDKRERRGAGEDRRTASRR